MVQEICKSPKDFLGMRNAGIEFVQDTAQTQELIATDGPEAGKIADFQRCSGQSSGSDC